MPIRDVVLFMIVIWLIPRCLRQPWVAILAFSWIGYMNPHRLTWGFAHDFPFALVFALCAFYGMLFVKDPEIQPVPWTRETWLLAILWGIYAFTTLFALFPDAAFEQLQKVSKILLFTFLTLKFFQTQARLRALFMVLALSIGFFGLKGGIWSVVINGGADRVQGPMGSFIGGNTELGLALNMVLPFLLLLARDEEKKWLRRLLYAMFVTSIIAIIFTYSRGALIGLPVVLAMLLLRARRRFSGLLLLGALVYFVYNFAPDEWFNRAESISQYETDESAQGRFVSWRVAWGVASDRPLTGGGFWVLPHRETFDRYAPGYASVHSAHSIYFAVLGDHGFPGLFVFVGLILFCLFSLVSLEWRLRGIPEARRLRGYCQMVLASLVAYAISGAFLTQAYWDLFYHLVAFVILLKVIAQREGFLDGRQFVNPTAKAALPRTPSTLPVPVPAQKTRAQRILR